jgi:ArsR family transcriptional regulator, arsenate/arsenite/antimonite-responsive transcriptional repressor
LTARRRPAGLATPEAPRCTIYNHFIGYSAHIASAAPIISERERQPGGCRTPLVKPDLSPQEAARLAVLVKALADPTRLRIVDAVRKASPEAVCQCELLPLFDISQAALARHLKVLLGAGLLGVERRGLWVYYFIAGEPRWQRLRAWLA